MRHESVTENFVILNDRKNYKNSDLFFETVCDNKKTNDRIRIRNTGVILLTSYEVMYLNLTLFPHDQAKSQQEASIISYIVIINNYHDVPKRPTNLNLLR